MKYNQRQQSALAQEFIEVLSIERNLGEKTLYAYKNDVDNMISWMKLRHQNELNAESIMLYFLYLQNEIELSCRSIRRKYVSIRQYCDFLNKTLDMNEVFFKFSSRKFQIPKNLPKTLSKTEIQSLISSVSAEFQSVSSDYHRRLCIRNMCIIELLFCLGLRIGDDDDKIRLNQRKPSKYKGLSRFGPEKNLQRINKFMKERPTFYKKLIQMKENFRFYLRCFYCITKVVILQFNSEKQDRISS